MLRGWKIVVLVLALLAVAPCAARAASRWEPPRPLAPGPVGNDRLFANPGADGFDVLGWFRYEPGSAFFRQVLSVGRRGQPPAAGLDVSAPHYHFPDGQFAANSRGDVVWAYLGFFTDGSGQSAVEIGVRPAGGAPGAPQRVAVVNAGTTNTPQIRPAVGPNGHFVVAFQGENLAVYAVTGRVGGAISAPVRLSAPDRVPTDELDLSSGIDGAGNAIVAWRDAPAGGTPREVLAAVTRNGAFQPTQRLSPPGEATLGPVTVAFNAAGDAIVAWSATAVYRPRGGGFGPVERHGIQRPVKAALDPDGIAFLAGPDPGFADSFQIAARPVNGRFLSAQRVNAGGTPRFDLLAPARGAGVVAWSGTRQAGPLPVRVAIVAADGKLGTPTVAAANPPRPVMIVALGARADGTALLAWGADAGHPYVDAFAQAGKIDLTAPEANRTELANPEERTLRYRVPGLRTFSVLRGRGLVPDGSEIDAAGDGLDLTVARGRVRETVSARGARFVVDQRGRSTGPTDLRLSDQLSCGRSSARASATRSTVRSRLRRLRLRSRRARFRSTGRYAAATVKGTAWEITDDCDSTTVRVTEGLVAVRDLVRDRTVDVRAGDSYTARKR